MEKMWLFLLVAVLLAVRSIIQKKYPEKQGQYAKTGKIIWTTLSIGLIAFMGFSVWYMLVKSALVNKNWTPFSFFGNSSSNILGSNNICIGLTILLRR